MQLIVAMVLTTSLMTLTAPARADGTAVDLPPVWAGLALGMTAEAFDRIACAHPECRHGRSSRDRVSYVIDAEDAQPLDLLPGSRVGFAVRWATFLRGRLVGFHAAPAAALPIITREALTTHVLRRFGSPAEALTTLVWCGRAGAELSLDPEVGWLAVQQIRRHGDVDADEAIDSICLIHN